MDELAVGYCFQLTRADLTARVAWALRRWNGLFEHATAGRCVLCNAELPYDFAAMDWETAEQKTLKRNTPEFEEWQVRKAADPSRIRLEPNQLCACAGDEEIGRAARELNVQREREARAAKANPPPKPTPPPVVPFDLGRARYAGAADDTEPVDSSKRRWGQKP